MSDQRDRIVHVLIEHEYNEKAEMQQASGDYDFELDGPDCKCGSMVADWPTDGWCGHVADKIMEVLS